MEFRLIYRGVLPAQNSGNSRVKDKHSIRRQFHPQLRELWKQNQVLSGYFRGTYYDHSRPGGDPTTGIEIMSRKFSRCGYQFLPLIGTNFGTACSLDILFLRRDNPGNFIVSGGDIDNRIKTLFDALRVPENCSEVDGGPQDNERPFFCLMESDQLITDVKVTTDRLLIPQAADEHVHDVQLVLHVKTKIIDVDKGFTIFA